MAIASPYFIRHQNSDIGLRRVRTALREHKIEPPLHATYFLFLFPKMLLSWFRSFRYIYSYSAFQFTLLNKLKLSSNSGYDRLAENTFCHYSSFLHHICSLYSFPLLYKFFPLTFIQTLLSVQVCVILRRSSYHWRFLYYKHILYYYLVANTHSLLKLI